VLGGPVIDGFASLPSTWIATESLAVRFNRPTKPNDLSQLLAVLGASQRDLIYNSLKVNRAGNEHLRAKSTRSTLVPTFCGTRWHQSRQHEQHHGPLSRCRKSEVADQPNKRKWNPVK
jgi:hypothetical protein